MATYHVGDSRNLKGIFVSESWNAPRTIISSPPYWFLKNYGNNDNQIGHGQDYKEYLRDTAQIFVDCYDVSEDNATLWVIVDTCMENGEVQTIPFDIVKAIKELGGHETWVLKDVIIWSRPKGVVSGPRRFKNSFEYILMFSKNDEYVFNSDDVRDTFSMKKWWVTYPERYNPSGKKLGNIWEFMPPMRGWGPSHQKHLCPLPFGMIDLIIDISTNEGDTILDPFAGSGTVLAIADAKKRIGVGIDVNEKFEKIYRENVKGAAKNFVIGRDKETRLLIERGTQFSVINKKLRALKLAGLLIEDFMKMTNLPKDAIKYVKYNSETKSMGLIIYTNCKLPSYSMSNDLKCLSKQSKIKIPVLVKDKSELPKDNMVVYRYHTKKTNKFNLQIERCHMEIQNTDQNLFFSDILLNVQSSDSILNKDLEKLSDPQQEIELILDANECDDER